MLEERAERVEQEFETKSLRRTRFFRFLTPFVLFGGSMIAVTINDYLGRHNAQAKEESDSCDPARYFSKSDHRLILASDCEEEVWSLEPTDNQKNAANVTNSLTNALNRDFFNIPEWEFPLESDGVNTRRVVSDQRILEIYQGNLTTEEGTLRLNVLKEYLNLQMSRLTGVETQLQFDTASLFYIDDQSTPNTVSQLTVGNQRYFGILDQYIFGQNIEFDQKGNPVAINEIQTAVRGGEPRIESSAEDMIRILDVEETQRGERSMDLPLTILKIPTQDPENLGYGLLVIDRSCGNIIQLFPVPFKEFKIVEVLLPTEETAIMIVAQTAAETPTPTSTTTTTAATAEILTPTATTTATPTITPTPSRTPTPTWTRLPVQPTAWIIFLPGSSSSSVTIRTEVVTATPTIASTAEVTITPGGPTATAESTLTPQPTPIPTATGTPTREPTVLPVPTFTKTPTAEATVTPQPTQSAISTKTSTPTRDPTLVPA